MFFLSFLVCYGEFLPLHTANSLGSYGDFLVSFDELNAVIPGILDHDEIVSRHRHRTFLNTFGAVLT